MNTHEEITIDSWLDNSKRKTFSVCERKFYYEYIRNLRYSNLSTAMFYGHMVHFILECYYKKVKQSGSFYLEVKDFTEIYDEAYEMLEIEQGSGIFTPDYRNWENAKLQFQEYYLNYCSLDSEQMEILETEQSLFMPWEVEEIEVDFLDVTFMENPKRVSFSPKCNRQLQLNDRVGVKIDGKLEYLQVAYIDEKTSGFGKYWFDNTLKQHLGSSQITLLVGTFYGGKIDLICSINGQICCMDHKTTAQALSLATKNQHWSPQFMGYQELAAFNGYPVTETIVNFLSLSCYFSKKTQTYNDPKFDFLRVTESYNKGDIASWKEMVSSQYKRYLNCCEEKTFTKNRDNCYQYGKCCKYDVLCSQNKPLGKELLSMDWIEQKWAI